MQSCKTMIHKLQTAINMIEGECLLIDKVQFYSAEQDRPISLYKISIPGDYISSNSGRRKKNVLFTTPSEIQVVLYLRDYLFHLQGKEIPTDNEMWNEIKKEKGIIFE